MPATGRQNNRGQEQNREAEQRETRSMSRARQNEEREGGAGEGGENRNPNIIVRSSGLDNFVPTIRRVNESDVKAKFQHQHLTPVEGEPTFAQMQQLEEELADNAMTAKVRFGGGKKGCLGVVYENAKFRIESGDINLEVPASQGAYPTFQTDATDDEKKAAISEFILNEHDILVVEDVEKLLKTRSWRQSTRTTSWN